MDRKAIIAIGLSIITLVTWQIYYAKTYRPLPTGGVTSAPAPVAPTPEAPAPEAAKAPDPVPPAGVKPEVEVAAEVSATPEVQQSVGGASAEYSFSNLGGGIARVLLTRHLGEHGGNVVMNEHGKIPIGAIAEKAGEASNLPYTVTVDAANQVVLCERVLSDQGVRLVKKFTLPSARSGKDEYLVQLEISFTNGGQTAYQNPGYFVHLGTAAPIHSADLPYYTGFDWHAAGTTKFTDVNWFAEGRIPLLGIQTSAERSVYTEGTENIWWAAVKNQYFSTIASSPGHSAKGVWARRFPVVPAAASDGTPETFGIEGAVGLPGFSLPPGETMQQALSLYIGPKEYARVKQLGNREDEIMNFGMFKLVSQFLLTAMNWLNSKLGNYATAIVVLTLFIKSVLWPLQNKATNSMKRMQALQPKMTELREKYKDDPTKMNQELMKLYKDYGINPVGGCLPMLIQIPIFFGFYSMLGSAVELRNSRFLWVEDLSQPDTVVNDLFGFIDINPLPLLMAATMVWQMAITPKTGDPVQQRIFMFVPLIFVFFCYNFASALALYWTVQNLFSIFQLYLTRNAPLPVLTKKKKR